MRTGGPQNSILKATVSKAAAVNVSPSNTHIIKGYAMSVQPTRLLWGPSVDG